MVRANWFRGVHPPGIVFVEDLVQMINPADCVHGIRHLHSVNRVRGRVLILFMGG